MTARRSRKRCSRVGHPHRRRHLLADGRRSPISKNQLQPGDLLFFNIKQDTQRAPNHVGIYVGGGMMVHDHGAHGGVSHQAVPWGAFYGARCYIASHSHYLANGTGGGGGGNVTTTTGGGGGGGGGTRPTGPLTVGTAAKKPKVDVWKGATEATIISAKASVTAMLTAANTVIGGMSGPMDAIERAAEAHLKTLREHLHPHMTAADLARTKAEIAKWGKVLNDEINEQTKRAKRAFDSASKQMLRAFDKETEAGLKARAAPDETPTEKLLREMQEARDDAGRQRAGRSALRVTRRQ
jgi:hypothetical protein